MSAIHSTATASAGVGYPVVPGFKERDGTSQAAGASISGRVVYLRDGVLATLGRAGNLTADETADLMGESVLSVRPRFTELALLGKIEKTRERRTNASGHGAAVWKLSARAVGGATR